MTSNAVYSSRSYSPTLGSKWFCSVDQPPICDKLLVSLMDLPYRRRQPSCLDPIVDVPPKPILTINPLQPNSIFMPNKIR